MVTILMATRNRAAQLAQTLERYCALQSPPGGWKAVIVDNGSSDDTRGVVQSFAARIPVECVREDRAGTTLALNTGIASVAGELVVFTDDDVLVPGNWLVRYQAEAAAHPEFSIFGGPIVPKWPGPLPPWIETIVHGGEALKLPRATMFSMSLGAFQTGPVEASWHVFGGNFAVRTSVLEQGWRFDPALGPSDKSYAMGSETEFLERLVKAGHRVWWLADLPVEHVIRPEQFTRSWILRRAVRSGRGVYRQTVYREGPPAFLFGAPRYVLRQFIQQAVRAVLAVLTWSR